MATLTPELTSEQLAANVEQHDQKRWLEVSNKKHLDWPRDDQKLII